MAVLMPLVAGCASIGSSEPPDWTAKARSDLEATDTDPAVIDCVLDLAARDLQRGPLEEPAADEAVRHCRMARLSLRRADTSELPNTELALTDVPWTFGDDGELDGLWLRCEQGEGQACDHLFERSAVGSDYEEFGVNCGNRADLVHCRDLDRPDPSADGS